MSARHKSQMKPGKLLTTRDDVIAFADFLSGHEPWLLKVRAGLKLLEERERLDGEGAHAAYIASVPRWRRILIRLGVSR